ncbi:hypothetical protein LTLLF_110005 [Microtus ochrogaster]|uniref:DUF4706 domain-containing protein n=1 Tax=Microtus ochrogaster TaxID=79684 RepID=A0A8J6GT19_MICOH|nr:hypothetical protein LTLLF_110005 [Microtus ochrogaster]
MASMAAAIAASRSAVMSGNRPLDDRERKRFTYFSSLSPMARKIMQDKEKIREKYGPEWARLPPAQQDEIIDRCLVGPRSPPAADAGDLGDPARFPGLRGPTGQKLVRFGDESQMEFSISSLSIQEPSTATVTSDPRPLAKAPQGTQAAKPAQNSRSSSLDALGPSRKEEEASFWKINAERSREGPEAEFQSLTPSQIKSMEKGEKVMPACYRQEPITKDREVKALPQEQQTLSSVSTVQEVPQPVQAPASLLPKATPIESPEKPPPPTAQQDDEDDALFSEPVFAQPELTWHSVIVSLGHLPPPLLAIGDPGSETLAQSLCKATLEMSPMNSAGTSAFAKALHHIRMR